MRKESIARIVIRTLGPLEVVRDGRDVSLPPSQRRLLSILLLDPKREWTAAELIDRMWGEEPPATARTALQVHVSGLRKSVPIVTTPGGYKLDRSAVEHDRDLLEQHVAGAVSAGHAGDWAEALRDAESAASLWRGRPFADVADESYSAGAIARIDELFLDAADVEVEASLAMGRNDAAILRLGDLIDRYPFHERLRRHLMLALYRSGRHGEALRAFQGYRRLLGETMGIEPGADLRDLEERILLHDPALGTAPLPSTPHNLPPASTSFIGREEELRRIVKELRETSPVTITGGPGFGKTRLAIEVGRIVLNEYPGGVWLAALSGAQDARGMTATIASAVSAGEGVDSLEDLAADLRARPVLLILDNCEHLVDVVSRFVLAIHSAPATCRVLATSRRRIGVPGESVHRLDPLAERIDESVALLSDRLRAVDRAFVAGPENLEALLEVCRRLEGIPLAIELVARWTPTLGLGDTTRLLDRIQADTALETAFEWSVALLPDVDRRVLFSLSVFESALTLERAVEVCDDDNGELATAGAIARLADASLLAMDWSGQSVRYRMLQPIRELARNRVAESDRASLSERHTRSFLGSATAVHAASVGAGQADAFATLDVEMADYRRAMAHLRDTAAWRELTTVIEALSRYWYARFLGWEGREWIGDVASEAMQPEDRARLHRVAGFLAWAIHDYDDADRHYVALHGLGIALGDRMIEADGLLGRGLVHQKRRFLDGAAMLEEAARIYSGIAGCELQLGDCLLFRGLDEAYTGDVTTAEQLLNRAVELLETAGNTRQVSKAWRWLAHCAWRSGDEERAREAAALAERLARSVGDEIALGGALVEQAHIETSWGEANRAADHLLEALSPIPRTDEIDIAQVFFPAARLAVRLGQLGVAQAVLVHVDDVYERHGWRPLDETVGITDLREAIGDTTPADGDVHDLVDGLLRGVAG